LKGSHLDSTEDIQQCDCSTEGLSENNFQYCFQA